MTEKRNEPIKVLAVVYKLMPAGLENRLMDILRNIDSQRVRIDVFTYQLEPGVYDEEVKRLGSEVFYNPPLTIKNMRWYVNYFREFLLQHPEYKIVHAHQDQWCSVFCKGAYLANVPVRIAHSRTALKMNSIGNIVKNVIKLPTKKYANYYFAVSENAGRWLFGNKMYNEGKVQIWPNAIDASKYYFNEEKRNEVRQQNDWEDKYIVMHVGNFTPPKNHPFIIKVFKGIYTEKKNALLVLVGRGDKKSIEDMIRENMIYDRVVLMGSRQDVNELLQGADAFLFPSIFEGLPGALVEAQAAGLPCVFSDTIAKEVNILPGNVILSLKEDSNSWARSVIATKEINRREAKKYIQEKGFDICTLVGQLCDFYEKAYGA